MPTVFPSSSLARRTHRDPEGDRPSMTLEAESHRPSRRWGLLADLLLLLLAFALIAWLDLQWVEANQGPPRDDDNLHLVATLHLRNQLIDPSVPHHGIERFVSCPGHYPPLVYQLTVLFYQGAGVSHAVAIASLMPFLLILMLSMYGIGCHLAGRPAGLACGVIAGTSPAVLELSRTYFLDMPATAMLAASLCSLLYSNRFHHRGWSLLFGLAVGLGMLTKWVHLGFLAPWMCGAFLATAWNASRHRWIGIMAGTGVIAALGALAWLSLAPPAPRPDHGTWLPFLPYLLASAATVLVLLGLRWSLRRRLTEPGRALLNGMEACALAVIVLMPWYSRNAHAVMEKVSYQAGVTVPYGEMLRSNLYDLSAMVYLGPYLLVLGTAVGLLHAATRWHTATLLAGSAAFVGVISLLPAATRYVLPILVFTLPLSMLWMKPLHRRGFVPVCLFLAVGLFQAAHFLVDTRFVPAMIEGTPYHRTTRSEWPCHASWRPVLPDPPEAGSYPYQDVLRAMDLDADRVPFVAFMGSRDSRGHLQPRSFAYHALLLGREISVVEPQENLETGTRSDVTSCDHLVVIYQDPRQRDPLLDLAWKCGWFPPSLESVATFAFSPDFFVEVLRRPRSDARARSRP